MAKMTAIFSTVFVVLVLGLVVSAGDYYNATCVFEPQGILGNNISGTITLYQPVNGTTTLAGKLSGFSNGGQHGFHVHYSGNLTNSCIAAGAHYNPFNKTHGGPNDTIRHVGDLGNIDVDPNNKNSTISIVDKIIQLYGNYSIIGRSLVVHSMPDDLGKGNATTSNTTGNSGDRIGCCVITLVSEPNSTTTAKPTSTTPSTSGATPSLILGPFTAVVALSCSTIHFLLSAVRNSIRL